jgi:hypothetical protein
MCFLNSFSEIQGDRWLLKIFSHITKPGVGLVGTTGSWSSVCPGPLATKKMLPFGKNCFAPWFVKHYAVIFSFISPPSPIAT